MENKTKKQIKNDKKRANQRESRFRRNREKKLNIKAKIETLQTIQKMFAENLDVLNFDRITNEINKLRKTL